MAKGENIFKRKDGRWEARYIKGYELSGKIKYTATFFSGGFPAIEINYPKLGKKEMRVLSREEQTRFVAYLLEDMDTCKFGVLLTLFTGVRIGELCALQWGNISLKEQTIRIDATLQRLRDTSTADNPGSRTRIVIGTPKSDTSIRTIPITDYTAELCGKMNPHSSAAYVLTGAEDYMEPRALQYRMEKYTRECGLKGVHFHTLRHTFATRAVEVGFEIKSLSEVLGHATTTITLTTLRLLMQVLPPSSSLRACTSIRASTLRTASPTHSARNSPLTTAGIGKRFPALCSLSHARLRALTMLPPLWTLHSALSTILGALLLPTGSNLQVAPIRE